MVRISFFFFLIVSINCVGQTIDEYTLESTDDKYYPKDSFIKSRQIKQIIDSWGWPSIIEFRIKTYDTLGLIISDVKTPGKNIGNPFYYRKNGDSLVRLKYNEDKTRLMSFERFVYNKKGQIVSYIECCNYQLNNHSYSVEYEAFYYDDRNMLKSKLRYLKYNYIDTVNDVISVNPVDLELLDVINYTHKTFKNGDKLIIGKQALGKRDYRRTDSAIYDKQNRLIKFHSYAKRAPFGEDAADFLSDVNFFVTYQYTDTLVNVTSYKTYRQPGYMGGNPLLPVESSRKNFMIELNRDKTRKAKYGDNGYVINKYKYSYY